MAKRSAEIIAVGALWLAVAAPSLAVDVSVVGLFPNKAIVTIDGGRPRTLSVGDPALNNVRLISATPDVAVLEIEGKRRTLGIGQGVYSALQPRGHPVVTLNADSTGHYLTTGSINGGTVKFLVDTGATMVSLGASDAKRLGIDYEKGQRGTSNTANGIASVYRVKLDAVKVGNIALTNVDGVVHESSDMPFVLLGMSFLGRLEIRQDGQQMTMMQKY